MKKRLRATFGLLLCAALVMSVLPVAAAGQEGRQMYSWTASSQAQDVQQWGSNLIKSDNVQIRWNDSGVIYTQEGSVSVAAHHFLNETKGTGNKAYGLPDATALQAEIYPMVKADNAGAIAVSFIYAYDFAAGGENAATSGKMRLNVSETGTDWSADSVGVRSAQLLGGGVLGGKQVLYYRVWSEDLLSISSLKAGDLIHGVRIQPEEDSTKHKGDFAVCELQLVAFSGKGAFTAAVPVVTVQQSGSKVDVDALRKQMLETARNSKATSDLSMITQAYSMVSTIAPANFKQLLEAAEIRMVGGITTKAAERVVKLFDYMYERDLLTKEQGDAMLAEYETIEGTKYILWDMNTPQQVMRGYAAAKPADILLQVNGNSGHAYMVVSTEPAYLADDFTIDPNNSKLTCLTPDGEKSYTYTEMYTRDYFVPVTLDVLADGKLASVQAEVVASVASKVYLTVAASLSIQRLELSMTGYTAAVEKPGSGTVIYNDSKLDAAVAALADGKHVLTVKVFSGAGEPIVKNVELQVKDGKASVLAAETVDHSAVCSSKAMTDVDKNAWYHEAVDYALTNGIMGGYNATTFGPEDTLSRAMVVQVLYNKEGQPAISGKHNFADVPANQWYNNAVTWGTQKGVMSGYNATTFGPDDQVTIEQVAVILWNYSGNPAFSGKADGVGAYSDWAANALAWAVENDILESVPFKNATQSATRAQTAQMLMNYLENN